MTTDTGDIIAGKLVGHFRQESTGNVIPQRFCHPVKPQQKCHLELT